VKNIYEVTEWHVNRAPRVMMSTRFGWLASLVSGFLNAIAASPELRLPPPRYTVEPRLT
jgi:hypothetical protein